MIAIQLINDQPYLVDRDLAYTYGVSLTDLRTKVAQFIRWNNGTDWLHLTAADAQKFSQEHPCLAFNFLGCQKVAAMFNTGYVWKAYGYIIKSLFLKEERKQDTTKIQEDLGL